MMTDSMAEQTEAWKVWMEKDKMVPERRSEKGLR
ncbi:hypothetical protein M3J09_004220 [Ascochyta lentis]